MTNYPNGLVTSAALAILLGCWSGAANAEAVLDGAAPPSKATHPRAAHDEGRRLRQQQRAQDLKTVLGLRRDQEPALSAFLATRRHDDKRRVAHSSPGELATATTPQRLDSDARRAAEHAERRQAKDQALRTFYAALSPDQQRTFDALQRLKGHGDHGRHGQGHGHRDFENGGSGQGED